MNDTSDSGSRGASECLATRPILDNAAAEDVVRLLYATVLRRAPAEKEAHHWAAHLLATQDPVALLRLFVQSPERRSLELLENASRTEFPAGHFYSPVVSRHEIERNEARIFQRESLPGIDLRLSAQIELFRSIARHARSLPFSDEPDGKHRYHYLNTSYGFGDACVYWGILASVRPQRLVEIGSGYTSGLVLDAIDVLGLDTECTFIDPYPGLLHKVVGPLAPRHRVFPSPVQEVPIEEFQRLEKGDILFVDSSHVLKTGSDVHFELTEVLPRIKPGVIVHFHDIFYPFEYPRKWIMDDNKSWNELYALHAFLIFNDQFEILFFNDAFAKKRKESVLQEMPTLAERFLLNPGGGLWLRRSSGA